jgi:ClpP class serine protease
MKNELTNHLATQRFFACEASQLHAALNASLYDIEMDDFFNFRPAATVENGIGIVSIQGLLTNGVPPIYEKIGYVTSYDTIKKEIEGTILAGAQAVQLNINSGGGSVNGAIELSRWIASLPVPTAAIVTSCACSAAYMLASATNRIAISETAQIGNIGTIMSWHDVTAWLASMGVEKKAITNEGATLKSTFHLEPNAEQLAFLQESANQHGATFQEFVSEQRTNLDAEVFRAGWYSGQRAIDLGLADEVLPI